MSTAVTSSPWSQDRDERGSAAADFGAVGVIAVALVGALVSAQVQPAADRKRISRTDARAAGGGRLPAGLDGIGQEHHGTQLTHPWLRTSPCPGQRFGEVAAVLNEQHVPTATALTFDQRGPPADNVSSSVFDPYNEACAAVPTWLGLPEPGAAPAPDQWTPTAAGRCCVVRTGSAAAHGQHWLASPS